MNPSSGTVADTTTSISAGSSLTSTTPPIWLSMCRNMYCDSAYISEANRPPSSTASDGGSVAAGARYVPLRSPW